MISAIGDVLKALSWLIILFIVVMVLGSILGVAVVDTSSGTNLSRIIAEPRTNIQQQAPAPQVIIKTVERYGKDCAGYDVSLASGPEYCFPPDFNSWNLQQQNQWIEEQRK